MAVFRRGSKWVARVYDPLTKGQRHVGTYATRKQAKAAEAEAVARIGEQRPGGDESVESFAGRWTRDYPRPKKSTNIHNAQMVSRFAREFGERALRSVSRPEARAFALAHPGNAPAVRAMYSDAVEDGLADLNPFAGLRIAKGRGRKDIVPITLPDLERLLKVAGVVWGDYGETTYRALISTAAYTGMRPGELHALEWSDIDFREGQIRVERQFSSRANEVTAVKNDRPRTIVLPAPAAGDLKRISREDPLVFLTQRGSHFTQRSHFYYWNPVRAAFGRPQMDFYELRHFCGSYLADLGVSPMDIAVQLGHQDGGRLAQELYIHAYEDNARDRIKRAWAGEGIRRAV